MITIKHNNCETSRLGSRGFSLIELMVVVAILGILAAAVGVYINNADAKLKSFSFNLGSRFKQAKFEAMKRGHDVYMDFDFGVDEAGDGDPRNDNGYTMWVDNNSDTDYDKWDPATMDVAHGLVPPNGLCDDDEGADCVIGAKVVFPNQANPLIDHPGPELYGTILASGPAAGPGGAGIDDGVSVGGDRFRFRPSGDCSAGRVYIYFPRIEAGAKVVAAGPWAIVVNTVGRIQLDEWKPELKRPGHSGWVSNE